MKTIHYLYKAWVVIGWLLIGGGSAWGQRPGQGGGGQRLMYIKRLVRL